MLPGETEGNILANERNAKKRKLIHFCENNIFIYTDLPTFLSRHRVVFLGKNVVDKLPVSVITEIKK